MYWINGTLQESLPFRILLPDGTTRTNLRELTNEQLAELEIYPAIEIKPEIQKWTQYYGEPTITIENGIATAVYSVINKTAEQLDNELKIAKDSKLAEIAEMRWREETKGITLLDGTAIKTDRESQSLLTGAAFYVSMNPEVLIDWKADGKWVKLNKDQLLAIADVVRQHVQNCFSKEKILAERINSCSSIEDVMNINWESE